MISYQTYLQSVSGGLLSFFRAIANVKERFFAMIGWGSIMLTRRAMRLVVFGLLGFVALGTAQKPEIKSGRMRPAPAESGQAMFLEYCAVCHGKDARGSGPALPALKVLPN